MGRLFRMLHEHLDDGSRPGAKALNWQGDPSPSKDSVPLRLAGALHALVLSDADAELKSVYPPHEPDDDLLWQAINGALHTHSDFICDWMDSAPQTNEVRRSNALYAGLCVAAYMAGGKPLSVLELGSSAGLNLVCDAYGYRFDGKNYGDVDATLVMEPTWHGHQPPNAAARISRRSGCDINPLDISSGAGRLRMRSYVWADQQDRLERMDKAIEIALSGKAPFTLEKADAETWLKKNLLETAADGPRVVMHSIAWQYFPQATQSACQTIIERAGAGATGEAPVFWLGMEADGKDRGAALTLCSWPGGEERLLARVDFHGRWIDWRG